MTDTILVGLIDQENKRYFILAAKEIRLHTEKKDMEAAVSQILNKEGNPLKFVQIYSEITKKEPGYGGLFEKYIQDILKNDKRFILLDKELWALTEWLEEEEQLYHNLYYADNGKDFSNLLQRCFQFLGNRAETVPEIQ